MHCPTCKTDKLPEEFYLHWKKPRKSCKECIQEADNSRRITRISKQDPDHVATILAHRVKVAERGPLPDGQQWCFECTTFKSVASFSPASLKNKGKCRECCNLYDVVRAMTLKKKAIEYLGGACQRCGFKGHWAAFDFHHHDPQGKEMGWGGELRKKSWENMKPELDKCHLLCRCCHSIVHSRLDDSGNPNPEYIAVNG